jgi:hypothetical protein
MKHVNYQTHRVPTVHHKERRPMQPLTLLFVQGALGLCTIVPGQSQVSTHLPCFAPG